MKKIRYLIAALFLGLFTLFSGFILPNKILVHAEESSVSDFDKTNVLDDLNGAMITGKSFNLKTFGFDETKSTQVICFLEYRYSFYESRQSDFGLYVYVYNPKGLAFQVNSSMHAILFKVGENKSDVYEKYPLSVVSISQGDYHGLFYKLKVKLTDEEREGILGKVNSTERVYSVSEIELMQSGETDVTSVPTNGIYKFSGYMSGYGSDSLAENSLKCTTEQLETLSLDVHPTMYRPEGTNGKNDYTQDSLHSVYFAVPNKVVESCGEMEAVHAKWLNAILAPVLVTGNQDAFAAIEKFLGEYRNIIIDDDTGFLNYPSLDFNLPYVYLGASNYSFSGESTEFDFSYNFDTDLDSLGCAVAFDQYVRIPIVGGNIDILYMLFNAGKGDDSADTYIAPSEDILKKLKESKEKFGGELVNDKYARCMFDSVDSEFTEKTIFRNEEYPLTSELIGSSWWDKLWGITTTKTFDGIKAIHTVTDSDFTNDVTKDCENLYIGAQDYDAFKDFYVDNHKDNTIYLFRYQVSDFVSQEASLYEACDLGVFGHTLSQVDTNAYFFQETVNLDFDIIDVTFSTGEEETVIPVVMSPIDIVPDGTPPVNTTSDKDYSDWWEKLIAVLGALVLVMLIGPFIGPILTGAGVVLKLFLKGISAAIKAIFGVLTIPFKIGSNKGRKG